MSWLYTCIQEGANGGKEPLAGLCHVQVDSPRANSYSHGHKRDIAKGSVLASDKHTKLPLAFQPGS